MIKYSAGQPWLWLPSADAISLWWHNNLPLLSVLLPHSAWAVLHRQGKEYWSAICPCGLQLAVTGWVEEVVEGLQLALAQQPSVATLGTSLVLALLELLGE